MVITENDQAGLSGKEGIPADVWHNEPMKDQECHENKL